MNMEHQEEYEQQFREMTEEEIKIHIGLEKVRNIIEEFPEDYGIEHNKN